MQVKYNTTNGISKRKLNEYALQIRRLFSCEFANIFPVLEILDKMSNNEAFDGLEYQVIEDDNVLFKENQLALYDYDNNIIYIKESVYDEASNDIGRARFTICHEIAHWFLFNVFDLYPIDEVVEKPPAYMDIEWQANYLASELLAPIYLSHNMTAIDIESLFKVSPECATVKEMQHSN